LHHRELPKHQLALLDQCLLDGVFFLHCQNTLMPHIIVIRAMALQLEFPEIRRRKHHIQVIFEWIWSILTNHDHFRAWIPARDGAQFSLCGANAVFIGRIWGVKPEEPKITLIF